VDFASTQRGRGIYVSQAILQFDNYGGGADGVQLRAGGADERGQDFGFGDGSFGRSGGGREGNDH
jgi:hypothetical protein